jgi:hypothetical protein
VRYGTWPSCGCARVDEPPPPPGGNGGSGSIGSGGGFNPGLGGSDVCRQFFTCADPQMLPMEGSNGECVCG